MKLIFRQTQLYKFVNFCNGSNLDKIVLDCGAGGNCPPLALFSDFGYKTYGIEMSESQIEKAEEFSKEHGIELNIRKGDIRNLPFQDESISFVYSYNTIFHMTKEDITKAVNEIKRVLKPGGICFVNFLTLEDGDYGVGEKVGEGEYLQDEGGEKVIHTYYSAEEAESHFEDMYILYKENRVLERIYEGERIQQGYIDFIVQKSK
ncbi:class I SAM-dependent methyltransferase [Inconstantimicrobium mannanitabidum]|uniref:S-adenosylmethionine-dependent methyltransferase n=1 Tax=Inconstantimicrobium mannanitabidum TaxID=1604901 RepID=A0ACB5RDP0_9CLOT|nr:class I SAM-dependent methyltransferase [Clostridium sp. TW13]GKX67014.1 S-adenosylmethionine-dependent methyltransferase [Clostridium sp. TW13]